MQEILKKYINKEDVIKIIYSESDVPHHVLGAHAVEEGLMINYYHPAAKNVKVVFNHSNEEYMMENSVNTKFFSLFIYNKGMEDYKLHIEFEDGNFLITEDVYSFESQITEVDSYLFGQGKNYEIYNKLGAHAINIKGIDGVYFGVWAPNARRVSVVGDFNGWDGRVHQMRRSNNVGIFELFIPTAQVGQLYKFEIKTYDGSLLQKSDPYGNYAEFRPNTASIITNLNNYDWNDSNWIKQRKRTNSYEQPMSIYEVHLGSWKKNDNTKEGFKNYRELAHELTEYVVEMGYTHVELMGISEHPFDGSWGYQVTGYYAPTSRYGTPEDFMYFVDYLHKHNISIILDWVPAHFPKDAHGLAKFDGTCMYEHQDPRQGEHPHWGTLIFNYGRNEVSNFLISNALFWVEKFHIDGLRVDAVASMLYLDYGKNDGEWVPNQYGGRDNLDAINFFKHLNYIMEERNKGAIVIAEESTAWEGVTKSVKYDGLGFSYKWNMGWMNDFIEYMKQDPIYRKYDHWKLTFSMVYANTEKFILVLSHDEVVHLKGSMIMKMPGEMASKFANLRTAYGFMFAHPGKKLLFMGQDFAQLREWSEERSLDWDVLGQEEHRQMQLYMKDLLHFYREHDAMFLVDHDDSGFEWMSCNDADHSIVSFVRKTPDGRGSLLFVCNFTPIARPEYRVGVPNKGDYLQCFTSDDEKYGGTGFANNRRCKSENIPWDGKKQSVGIDIPALGVVVFEYTHKFIKAKNRE